MSRRTRTLFNVGYFLVLALLAANGLFTIVNLRTIVASNRRIDHTREVVIELERAFSTLEGAETSQRGYLLTGEREYLEPYHAALTRVDSVLRRLAALTSDNPSQQRRIAQLRRLEADKMAELGETIALRDREGTEAALAVVRTHRGKRVMDQARQVVVAMAQEEDRLLRQRSASAASATRWAFVSFVAATAMALALLAVVYLVKRREDIEQGRAALALARSEERLRQIVDSADDYVIFTTDLDGCVTTWNSGAAKITGYAASEMLGRDSRRLFIPEDIERGIPEHEMQKAHALGRAENERWHVRKDGTRFWASGLLMPVREEGRIIGWLKIMRDVTDQKRTEQELELSRERFDLVVSSSEVGLWYCDLPFDALVWSPKCKEHFGLPPDAEVTIETFYERLHPDDRERTRRAIEQAIDGRNDFDIVYRSVAPEGRVRWLRAIGRAYYELSGVPLRFDGITVDVTERILQEEALRETDRKKDEFLATLAHELRNPLAAIRNALHLMAGPSDNGQDFDEERAIAERQVTHLARLVDDLMDVARISTGKLGLRKEEVELGAIVGRAVEAMRSNVRERDHVLEVALPPGRVRLEGDPTRLEQVFWNLLNNAAKYTEPGGRIRLGAAREDGEAVVRIRDTGIGIAPELLPHIFDMFVQAEHGAEPTQSGLGIGLALVKALVELHGGTITVRSEGQGRGSEFIVRLPALPETQPAPGASDRNEPPAELPRRRVLVVDDNADAARSLAKLLQRVYGQDVRVAHDGPSALAEAEAFRPAIVLLDIGMPGMDGHEVARRLRARPEFTPGRVRLVALTGWGQESDRQRSNDAGFDRHLVKPVGPAELRDVLAEAAASSQ